MTSQRTFPEDLLTRHPQNPILDASSWTYSANTVFNPAATLLADGTTLMLCRVEDRRGISHLTAARSANGIDGWQVNPQPTLAPDPNYPEEIWGVEDARITFLPELGRYGVLYTSYSPTGPGVSLALTADFHTFERMGQVMPPEDKDAALFPHKINGRWAMMHRPVNASTQGGHIWLSYSDDLVHWTDRVRALPARVGAWWDASKIGLCCPPIETAAGWLVIYHGVKTTGAGVLYRLGLALFDLQDPSRCTARGDEWIFGPQEPYERFGDVGYVTFPCGTVIHPSEPDTLRVYYGAADTCIGLTTGSIQQMLAWLKK